MPVDEREFLKTQVDVGVLKEQVSSIATLCGKMDLVIQKLVEQNDRHIAQVYKDMDKRRIETDADIKEIHDRIDTVLDKVQNSELRLMQELKSLRDDMIFHNKEEKDQLNKILQWKWMIVGGIITVTWIVANGLEYLKPLLTK
jgi:hypothetical protein